MTTSPGSSRAFLFALLRIAAGLYFYIPAAPAARLRAFYAPKLTPAGDRYMFRRLKIRFKAFLCFGVYLPYNAGKTSKKGVFGLLRAIRRRFDYGAGGRRHWDFLEEPSDPPLTGQKNAYFMRFFRILFL